MITGRYFCGRVYVGTQEGDDEKPVLDEEALYMLLEGNASSSPLGSSDGIVNVILATDSMEACTSAQLYRDFYAKSPSFPIKYKVFTYTTFCTGGQSALYLFVSFVFSTLGV